MTKQEIFNKVCEHLMKQKVRAYDDANEICCYRAPDGKMCAVGCLIPDDLYSPSLEGCDSDGLLERSPAIKGMFSKSSNLLRRLQIVHDRHCSYDNEPARSALRHIARDYKLKQPACIKEPK